MASEEARFLDEIEEGEKLPVADRQRQRLTWAILGGAAASVTAAGVAAALAAFKSKGESGGAEDWPSAAAAIQDPETMAEFVGFTPAPIYWFSIKGWSNFLVQMVLLLGPRQICGGRKAIEEGLRKPLRVKWSTIFFQVLGLASTEFAIVSLAITTEAHGGWTQWTWFAYALSQHSCTVTLLVGLLGNNFPAAYYIEDHADAAYSEKIVARGLAVIGFVVGLPLWAALLSVGWFGLLAYLLPAMCFAVVLLVPMWYQWNDDEDFVSWLRAAFEDYFPTVAAVISGLSIFSLAVLWIALGITDAHAWHVAGATVLELSAPLVVGITGMAVTMDDDRCSGVTMITGFCLAMASCFCVMMLLPTSLLALDAAVGYRAAPSAVFMGRKGGPFVKHTFVLPAKKAMQIVEEQTGFDCAQRALLVMTQLVSFLT